MFPKLRHPRWPSAIAVALSLSAMAASAHAESEPATKKDRAANQGVTLPVAIDTSVGPVSADASAEVILELLIDALGNVSEVTLVSGPEPFATAALSHARAWKFRPAYRGNEPIPARIQFLVRFTPDPVEPPPAQVEPSDEAPRTTEPEPPTPPQTSAKAEAMSEVLVLGRVQDPVSRRFTRAEVRNLPGAFGDPLRAVDSLPGVTPITTGLPLYFVRGAPPGNVGYFIDGIRIPLLYHGFLGPSVIHPSFIDEVALSAGPVPARFGRFAGATVEASLAEPRQDFRGEAHIRLFDAGAFVEAPFAKDRGYLLLGGRYSFTALLVSLLTPGVQAEYWDYQAIVGYRLSKKDDLRLFGFGAFDLFTGGTDALGGTEFHRIDGRYRHQFDDKTNVHVAASFGRDRTRSSAGYLADTLVLSRARFDHVGEKIEVSAGADISIDNYESLIDKTVPEPEVYESLFPRRTDASGGAYASLVLFPRGRVRVVPGLRFDVFSSLGRVETSVDPRIFAEFRLTPKVRVVQGFGVAHQTPNFVPSVPAAQVGGLGGGLQESLQTESRVEVDLPWEVSGSLAGFINGTSRLSDPIGLNQTLAIDETSRDERAFGRAYGIEIMFKRPLTRRLGGLLSYTLMQSRRSFDTINTVPGYDRPNMLNFALTYDFGRHIRGSAKFSFAEGIPGRRTTEAGFIFDGSRGAPLYRLDLKVEKRWYLTEASYLAANIEVLNATYSPNVTRRTCNVLIGGCQDEGTSPIILPSVGVEFGWR
jgi:Gram-negative bacterial TonB protein C-terminal/TonB-dependent Receptor Plug Domain/TonB dependent receptor